MLATKTRRIAVRFHQADAQNGISPIVLSNPPYGGNILYFLFIFPCCTIQSSHPAFGIVLTKFPLLIIIHWRRSCLRGLRAHERCVNGARQIGFGPFGFGGLRRVGYAILTPQSPHIIVQLLMLGCSRFRGIAGHMARNIGILHFQYLPHFSATRGNGSGRSSPALALIIAILEKMNLRAISG